MSTETYGGSGQPIVDFDRDVYCLLGLPFDAVRMNEVTQIVYSAAILHASCFISTPNLNFLIGCRNDDAFRESVINSNLSIADGMPLVWIARFLGIPIRERIAGSGLFETLRNNKSRLLSVYFFGGPDGAAETAYRRLNAETSGLHCAGYNSPGFGSIDDMSSDGIIADINASKADFLLVSLGAKKGQAWIERNRARILVPVISHLGAVVNFVAGTLKRAPVWMQRGGMEWLWRIKEEPKLWRRYFSDGMALIHLLWTRVIPNYLFIHQNHPTQKQLDAAAIIIRQVADVTLIVLRGAWTRKNLGPMRQCFAMASMTGRNVQIDLKQVSYIDAAFLGVLLLLHGQLMQQHRRLSCTPLNRRVRKVFEFGCCEFLLNRRPA